jgi:diaminobutyrate-2-oxoglutarate transaminase
MNFGHNHEAIKAALIDYITEDGLPHGLDLHTSAKSEFLERLSSPVCSSRAVSTTRCSSPVRPAPTP